jgi:CheY-like chemotaxis protein
MGRAQAILLIEDDLVDAMTVKRAMEDIGASENLIHLRNGEEALDYLQSDVNDLPFLILLDLNMPRMNGMQFLQALKQDTRLSRIPVIVLTTSADMHDVERSFQSSAVGYMVKPVDYQPFVETIRTIKAYWRLSRLPV